MHSVKQMMIYGIGIFVLKGFGFLMMPVVTRILTQVEYGELNFLVSIAALVSLFLTLGLGEALFRFSDSFNTQERAMLMRQCFLISLVAAVVFLVFSLVLSHVILNVLPVELHLHHLQLLLLSLAFSTLLTVPYCYFRMTGRAFPFMVFSVSQGVIQTGLSITLLLAGLGVKGMMISSAVSSGLIALAVVYYFRRELQGPRLTLTLQHYKYIGFIICSTFFLYCLNGAENWLVVMFLGKQQLAIFFAASQFALMISIAFEPFRMWWFARRFQIQQADPKNCADLTVLGVQIGILIAATMLVASPLFMGWILPESYAMSITLLPWMCLIMAFKFHSELLNIGCYIKKSASYAPLINGVSAVVLLSSSYYLLYVGYGVSTLLACMVITAFIRCSLFYIVSQRLVYLDYPLKRLASSWVFFVAILLLALFKPAYWEMLSLATFSVNVMSMVYCYRGYFKEALLIRAKRAI